MVPNSKLKEKGKQVVFKLILQMKEVKYFLNLWMKKPKHILWYDPYLLLTLELQHQNTSINVNCYHLGSWNILKKLNKGRKLFGTASKLKLLPSFIFFKCIFTIFFVLSFGCLLSVHIASSQGIHYSSFKRMKMIRVKFIYYIKSKTISISILNTGVVIKSFWYLNYKIMCRTHLFSSLFQWNVIIVN